MDVFKFDREIFKNVWPEFIRFRCACGNTWGIRLPNGKPLTEKDLTCSTCLMKRNFEK